MPELDLGPDDYKVRTRRGRWVAPDAGYMVPFAAVMALLWIGFAWWYRAELPLVAVLSVVAVASCAFGMVLGAWLKRFD